MRRIIGKVSVVLNYKISAIGSLQVCPGQEADCETEIHAMHTIFEEKNAVLLVDEVKAFNFVN